MGLGSSVFVTGNSGRITLSGVTVASLARWTMTKNTKPVQLLTFESPVDGDGNVWENQLVGTSNAKIAFEGWIDVNAATAQDSGLGLRNGLTITMSLILVKGTPWGFNQVSAQIDSYEVSSAIDADKPSSFKGTAMVQGIVGSTTTVTG